MKHETQQPGESVNPNYRRVQPVEKRVEEYVEGIKTGNRTLLSQAITLVESSREDHRAIAEQIVDSCLKETGNSIRIGISGVPGVGKSTFIDSFGKLLISNGKKPAILTVDPSSSRSGGSILGDKTRMQFLSSHPDAYVRPSPSGGFLGGVARKTREVMLLCEAAGFDTLIIETVGVGQSETTVHSMTDFFLLLMLAGAGDELQGIKRGVMELADMVVINKADGGNRDAAIRAKSEYENALSLFPVDASGWKPPVRICSALEATGIEELWNQIETYFSQIKKNNYFQENRKQQAVYWMYEHLQLSLREQFFGHPEVSVRLREIEKEVENGLRSSFKAASDLIKLIIKP